MGYYTYFSLSMYGDPKKIEEVEDYAETLEDDTCMYELVTTGGTDAKWYNFDNEFAEFAKKFPDILFVVGGSGEDSDDIWECRFKGTDVEKHYVEMPPFELPSLQISKRDNNK